jgi:biotin operon repressor
MLETSARLLRLLSLLQARRDWTSGELAARLGVTTRTIRNDIDRLRGLGYPVEARPGVAGGYRLGAGGALPPLLLDDEEAVAVAIGLRTAASDAVAGIEESSVRALAKLQQVLPARLRRRVSALVPGGLGHRPGRLAHLPGRPDGAAAAARPALHAAGAAARRGDPGPGGARNGRGDLALPGAGDRACLRGVHPRPAADPGRGGVPGRRAVRVRARLRLPRDARLYLGMLGADFTVVDAPELVTALRELTERYQRAIAGS